MPLIAIDYKGRPYITNDAGYSPWLGFYDADSVLAYGADPTGSADSSAAFAAAIATSDHIKAPPGTYKLNTGFSLNRRGVKLEVMRGAQLRPAAMVSVDAPECALVGHAPGGFNFDAGVSGSYTPNVLWTGGNNSAVVGLARNGSAAGSLIAGLGVDANGTTGCKGFLVSKTGTGCSGSVVRDSWSVDMDIGMSVESSLEVGYILNCSHARRNVATFGTTGLAVGADANNSGNITSTWIVGGCIQNFTTGIQVGGSTAPATTVWIRDLVLEGLPGSGGRHIWIYNVNGCSVSGCHMETGINTDDTNRNIILGASGTLATSVGVFNNYLTGTAAAFEGRGWDGGAIFANWIDVTNAVTSGVPFKNVGGGIRRTSMKWFGNLKIGRGTHSQEFDVDDETGFSSVNGENRDGNNVQRSRFKASNEAAWSLPDATPVAVYPGVPRGMVTLTEVGQNRLGLFSVSGTIAPVKMADVAARYSTTALNNGTINLYVSGSNLMLENKTGGAVSVGFRLDE